MSEETKRTTVYLDQGLYRALKIKAAQTDQSLSSLINDAIGTSLEEDYEDLAVIRQRQHEKLTPFEDVLEDLKKRGKI
ncbi:MAG: CopG family transcriptional regulator [Gammaproteobacteria bacterium]|nr:CopG family transcriptional regulator [Gammaproteobacteria bacterium]